MKRARSIVRAGRTSVFLLALLLPVLLPLGGCKVVASRLRIAFGIPAPRPPFVALEPLTTSGWQRVAVGRVDLALPPTRDNETLYATLDGIELGRREMLSLSFDQIWAEHHKQINDGEGDIQSPHTLLKMYDPAPGHEKTEATALFEENLGTGPQDVLEHWQQFGKVVFWGRARFPPAALGDMEWRMSEVFAALRLDRTPGVGDFAFYEAAIRIPPGPQESVLATWDLALPVEKGSVPLSVRLMVADASPAAVPAPTAADRDAPKDPLAGLDRSQWRVVRQPTRATLAGRDGLQTSLVLRSTAQGTSPDAQAQTESYSASWNSDAQAANAGGSASSLSFDTSSYLPLGDAMVLGYWDALSSSLHRR